MEKAKDPFEINAENPLVVGSHGEYHWLAAEHQDLAILNLFPEIALHRSIAVTALDSGSVRLHSSDIEYGWESRKGIVYHPHLTDLQMLPAFHHAGEKCEGFNEMYIFREAVDLGEIHHGNLFKKDPGERGIIRFANVFAFSLHHPDYEVISDLFWEQLKWVNPESYIADGFAHSTFVTRDEPLFQRVYQTLRVTSAE